jgi:hypothetical protein
LRTELSGPYPFVPPIVRDRPRGVFLWALDIAAPSELPGELDRTTSVDQLESGVELKLLTTGHAWTEIQ